MASEQDMVAIPSEPLNDSQANNPVLQTDNTNMDSGCSNEQMEIWTILNVPNRPPIWRRRRTSRQSIQFLSLTIRWLQLRNQKIKKPATGNYRRNWRNLNCSSSRTKGKTTENSTPSNSAGQRIDSNEKRKISGLIANPFCVHITKVVVLSGFVLPVRFIKMLRFKLKLDKINLINGLFNVAFSERFHPFIIAIQLLVIAPVYPVFFSNHQSLPFLALVQVKICVWLALHFSLILFCDS